MGGQLVIFGKMVPVLQIYEHRFLMIIATCVFSGA
jgi:hypothetical protein